MLAFLPSAHIAQRIALELLALRMGVPVWFSESLARMPHEFKTVKPTFFLAPPRVWERVYSTVRTELQKLTGFKRTLAFTALGAGQKAAQRRQRGESVPFHLALPLKLFDKLVFAKIRDRFGGQLRFPISGAAPLSTDLGLFYDMIGLPLIEGFGLTEGGINCLNPVDKPRLGSIGKPLPGVVMKISEEGYSSSSLPRTPPATSTTPPPPPPYSATAGSTRATSPPSPAMDSFPSSAARRR